MKAIALISLLIIFNACSMLPPSAKEYRKIIDRRIGMSIQGNHISKAQYYKIERKKKYKYYYRSGYSYSTKAQCRIVYITNLKDIIVDYKILTPNTCKIGTSVAW